MHSLYIFRRDLRIADNKGLIYANKNYKNIIPIFIFTPEQVLTNKFKSNNAIQFMCESLIDLENEFKNIGSKLFMFYGKNTDILKKIFNVLKIESVVFNMDYTPYALERDTNIKNLCDENNIKCEIIQDYLLSPIGTFNKSNGNPYTVFTPFYNNAVKFEVDKPNTKNINNYTKNRLKELEKISDGMIEYEINDNILVNGGRKNGLKLLNKIPLLKKYDKNRNTVSIPTSYLSAYIKFGCISIREVYWKIRNSLGIKDILKQLFWREFYFYIAFYFPKVLNGKNFNDKYDKIKWNWSKKHYIAWCKGMTGFPIVDAGMRELNETGFMHNRSRLITSNFLNRILGMDWRWSEIYFAKNLTDYDPSVNSGNHQWIASVGTDPKPYFQRLFNPWIQGKKFDENTIYIKKWIPELKDIEPKEIHEWYKYYKNHDLKKINYNKPIIDYKLGRENSIKMYKEIL